VLYKFTLTLTLTNKTNITKTTKTTSTKTTTSKSLTAKDTKVVSGGPRSHGTLTGRMLVVGANDNGLSDSDIITDVFSYV